MARYVAHRLLMMVGILFGVLIITFGLSRVLPGSPVEMMLGAKPTQEQIAEARDRLGLNETLPEQFLIYLKNAARGDFGTSLRTGQPVTRDIANRASATVELVVVSLGLSLLFGLPLGVISAVRQDSWVDHAARAVSIAGVALPAFFIGMLLQMLFYGTLEWLPLQARIGAEVLLDHPFETVTGLYLVDTALDGNWIAFKSAASHLALPVLTMTLATIAIVTRNARAMMVDVLGEDYILTSRAYGIPARTIHYRYALKATLIPVLTVVGLTFGYMLGGSVVVEYVFDWPGLGGYVVGALINNDFPAVMGVTLVLATAYLMINLAVDLAYHLVDPRLRRS
ncbi:MAG: ABC transporter permease [Gammaproteobacteria bacterium]|nr:ABC transporter permease [Gammaproteobacteria bacterium]